MITHISQYQPAGHKIVVKYIEEKSTSGLVLPASSASKSKKPGWFGEVVSISPAADLVDAGCKDLKIGDIIDTDCIFNSCRQIEIGSETFLLINDGDICGIIKK